MRPIKVEFQAFGPYIGHETVDFDAISKKGLFLICGKTGIGKTMILDAMTFALYGKSSGHGRDHFQSMRCTNAGFDTTTFVLFDFENNGEIYRFERRLERKRIKLSESYNLSKKDENGIWQPLLENPKEKALNDMAEEIIGLDYNQFRQVIILPQGQFENFLTSNSDEKEKILTSIFGEEQWQHIADILYNEASARKESLRSIKEMIANSLREENCSNIAELEQLISRKKEEQSALDENAKAAAYDNNIRELNDTRVIIGRFNDLKKAQNKIDVLNSRKDEIKEIETRLEEGKRALKVKTLMLNKDEASRALKKREDEEKNLIQITSELEEKSKEAEVRLSEHKKLESQVEEKKALKIQYETKRSGYESIDAVKIELMQFGKDEEKALTEEKKAKEKLDAIAENITSLQEEYNKANAVHSDYLNQYISGIKGELAKDLKEGIACPVCGSTTHPSPAPVLDSHVTKEMVEEKKHLVDEQFQKLQDTFETRDIAQMRYEERQYVSRSCHAKVVEWDAKYEVLKRNLVEGIDSLKELNDIIVRLDKDIQSYIKTREVLEKNAQEARNLFTNSRAKIEPAREEIRVAKTGLENADKEVMQCLKENGFVSEEEARKVMLDESELEKLGREITDYRASLKTAAETLGALREELKGKEEPDEASCLEKIEAITEAKSAYEQNRAVLASEIERLSSKKTSLENEGTGIEEKIREAEEDFTFAKRLRGDTGTGLRRYVLGIMFSSVVVSANKMLEMVHGGRYRLFRSDEKAQGTNKTGLELKVFDRNSEEHEGRFVSTLSGGEKFLVSLALSIGMSTVAQKSGIKINALFIDEGFGSLDEESISDAMDILNSIQAANGLVGIISHVQILQDRIPTKLIIESKDGGSHIIQSIG